MKAWRAGCRVGSKYTPGCFDSLRGSCDVSLQGSESLWGGILVANLNSSYSLVHPLGGWLQSLSTWSNFIPGPMACFCLPSPLTLRVESRWPFQRHAKIPVSASESPRGLINTQILRLTARVSDSLVLRRFPRICISNKLQGGAYAYASSEMLRGNGS